MTEEDVYKSIFDKEPDPENFEEILTGANAELTRDYYDSRTERIMAIVKFSGKEYQVQVEEFLKNGFKTLKSVAAKKADLINTVLFDALVRAITQWGNPAFADLLIKEFTYITSEEDEGDFIDDGLSRHYELNIISGTIALALAELDYKGDFSCFERFLASYEWRYPGEIFVMQVRYAKWMIEKNITGPVAFINNSVNKKGIVYAVAALADLNCKDSIPLLQELLTSKTNQVFSEVLKEAIIRLKRQEEIPAAKDRLIHLFGVMTPTEKALTGGNDNVFEQRASEVIGDTEFVVTKETDDSAVDDR